MSARHATANIGAGLSARLIVTPSGRWPRTNHGQIRRSQRTTARGFIVHDYEDRAEEARDRIGHWVDEGKIE